MLNNSAKDVIYLSQLVGLSICEQHYHKFWMNFFCPVTRNKWLDFLGGSGFYAGNFLPICKM